MWRHRLLYPEGEPKGLFDIVLLTGKRMSTSFFNYTFCRQWPAVAAKLQLRVGSIVALTRLFPAAAGGPCTDLLIQQLVPLRGATALAAVNAALCPCSGRCTGDISGWPLAALAPETVTAAVGHVRAGLDDKRQRNPRLAVGGKRPAGAGGSAGLPAKLPRLEQQPAADGGLADTAVAQSCLTTAVTDAAAGLDAGLASGLASAACQGGSAAAIAAEGCAKAGADESAESPPTAAEGSDAAIAARADSSGMPTARVAEAAAAAATEPAWAVAEGRIGASAAGKAALDAAEGSGDAMADSCSTASPASTAAEAAAEDAAGDAAAESGPAAAGHPALQRPEATMSKAVAAQPVALAPGKHLIRKPWPRPPLPSSPAAEHLIAADAFAFSRESDSDDPSASGGRQRCPVGTPSRQGKPHYTPVIRNAAKEHAAGAVHPLVDGPVTVALPVQNVKKWLQLPHRLLR